MYHPINNIIKLTENHTSLTLVLLHSAIVTNRYASKLIQTGHHEEVHSSEEVKLLGGCRCGEVPVDAAL